MPRHANEATLLMDGERTKQTRLLRQYLSSPISLHHADLPLLACCFVTGIIDAGAYNAWGTFMGMQTGNTIFLALGAAGLPKNSHKLQWLRSFLAITTFMLGSCISSYITGRFGNTRRISLSTSFIAQGLSIFVAAILVATDVVPQNRPESVRVLIGIPLLSWQFGGQVAASRVLGYSEIPTTVLTSVYNDLASDPNLWKWRNAKRNRRMGAAAMLLLGGICGGWLSRIGIGFGIVLWIGGCIKILLGIIWLTFREANE